MSGTSRDTEALRGQRIRVVEDEPLIAMDLVPHMGPSRWGPPPTVKAALAGLAEDPPDLAVLDLDLRGERSVPVAIALRDAGVPFVLTTGYARTQIEDPELAEVPLVPKPVDPRRLVEWLMRLLVLRRWRKVFPPPVSHPSGTWTARRSDA